MFFYIIRRLDRGGRDALRHQHQHVPALLRQPERPRPAHLRQELHAGHRRGATGTSSARQADRTCSTATSSRAWSVSATSRTTRCRSATHPQTIATCAAPCLGYSLERADHGHRHHRRRPPRSRSRWPSGAFVLWMVVGVDQRGDRRAAPGHVRWTGCIVGVALDRLLAPDLLHRPVAAATSSRSSGSWCRYPTYTPFTENPVQWASGLILPWITLAAVYAALYVRLTRAYMLETMSEDYIRTARAKGRPGAQGRPAGTACAPR